MATSKTRSTKPSKKRAATKTPPRERGQLSAEETDQVTGGITPAAPSPLPIPYPTSGTRD